MGIVNNNNNECEKMQGLKLYTSLANKMLTTMLVAANPKAFMQEIFEKKITLSRFSD